MKFLLKVILIAYLYYLLFILLNNYSLILTTFSSSFQLQAKVQVLLSLIIGSGTSMTVSNLIILCLIALLTGINMVLLFEKIQFLQASGSLTFLVGGSSVLGIVSSGCASCGLPLLAFLGLGSSLSVLPFHGYEFSILSILALTLSTYILSQKRKQNTCTIPNHK